MLDNMVDMLIGLDLTRNLLVTVLFSKVSKQTKVCDSYIHVCTISKVYSKECNKIFNLC